MSYNTPPPKEKLGLLARFQRIFNREQELVALNIPAYEPTNSVNDGETQALQAIEPIEPNTPQPVRVWIDNSTEEKVLTTEIGSQVEDPYLDNLRQSSLSSDVQERATFYDQIDLLYANDPVSFTARENLLKGAFGANQEQEVEPAKGQEKNQRAIEMAYNANKLWQRIANTITPEIRKMRMREYLTYGNLFIRVDRNIYGVITNTKALPTKTIKINSNHNLKFYPNQPDAYQQFTRNQYAKCDYFWPEIAIIPILNTQFESDRYGMPFILPALGYVRGLIKGTSLLPDAREMGLPFIHENHQDAIGNAVSRERINESNFYTREQQKNRNEAISPFQHKVTNGKVLVEMLNTDGSYWNSTNDLTWFASNIAAIFNRNLAKQNGAQVVNRATLDRITETEYEEEYRLALLFATLHDVELLNKQIAIANFAVAQLDESYGLEPNNLFIDPTLVKLVTKVKAKQLPERLISKAKLGAILYTNGGLSQESFIEAGCEALEFSFDREMERMRKEGLIGYRPSKPMNPEANTQVKESFIDKDEDNLLM